MSDLTDSLEKLLEPEIEKAGYELVAVEFKNEGARWVMLVYIDNEKGITIDDCVNVNRIVDEILVNEDPIKQSFTLEVSSPGIFRPLIKPDHYSRFIGERIKLKLFQVMEGKRKYIARLVDASENCIKIVTEEDEKELEIPYQIIAKANLEPVLNF